MSTSPCHSPVSSSSPSRSTVSPPVKVRATTHRSVTPAKGCTSGCSPPGTWTERVGQPGGSGGVDDAFLRPYELGIGAEIMGAGKFGPPGWHEDPEWKGWWGANPPFHTPTFILTHHPRPPIEMEGGTTFHFLDAPRAELLETAREAAGGWSGGANDRLRSCNTQLSAGIHGRPGRTCNHRDSMDASTVGLVGVVVGGLLSAGTGFGAAFIQSKRDRDLWKPRRACPPKRTRSSWRSPSTSRRPALGNAPGELPRSTQDRGSSGPSHAGHLGQPSFTGGGSVPRWWPAIPTCARSIVWRASRTAESVQSRH